MLGFKPRELIEYTTRFYRIVYEKARAYGVKPIVVGAAAYAVQVKPIPARHVDLAVSSPLDMHTFLSLFKEVGDELRASERLIQIRACRPDDRYKEGFIAEYHIVLDAGRLGCLRIHNLLLGKPASTYETVRVGVGGVELEALTPRSLAEIIASDPRGIDPELLPIVEDMASKRLVEWLDPRRIRVRLPDDIGLTLPMKDEETGRVVEPAEWERMNPLTRSHMLHAAAGIYMSWLAPEEKARRIMASYIPEELIDSVAAAVWKVAMGEGYTVDEWYQLLRMKPLAQPLDCIWRFQWMVEKGWRRRPKAKPHPQVEDILVIHYACKLIANF